MAGNLEIIISHNANTYISTHRVARLSTSDSKGQPHVIPICYGFDGQYIYTALDFKSKRVEFRKLKRVTNILSNPQVAVVVDDFSEDWNDLSYILIIGHAKILENGLKRDAGEKLLRAKYYQYFQFLTSGCPILKITPNKIIEWRNQPE